MKSFNAAFAGTHKGRNEQPMEIKTMVAAMDEHAAAIALESNYEGIEGLLLVEVEL